MRRYKIHVKRIKGQRIKKCRGFKRLIFKSILISQPEYIVKGYDIINKSPIEKRKIYDLIYRNYLYKGILRLLVNKYLYIKYRSYVSSFKVSIVDRYNNNLFPILKGNNIELLKDNYLNFPEIINFQFKFKIYLNIIGNKKEFY